MKSELGGYSPHSRAALQAASGSGSVTVGAVETYVDGAMALSKMNATIRTAYIKQPSGSPSEQLIKNCMISKSVTRSKK